MTTTQAPVTVQAPAKIILIGEHAVVYGHPAIALPFPPVSATATLTPSEGPTTLTSDRYPGQVAQLEGECPERLRPLKEAVAGSLAAIARTGAEPLPFRLHVESEIPPGAGLGSSAAVAVAVIRGVFAFHGCTVMPALLRNLATQAEAIAHGASSGLDPTSVAAHGPVRFVRDHAPIELRVTEPFGLVVAHSGESCETGSMVQQVKMRQEASDEARQALEQLGELAEQGAEALERAQYSELGRLMNEAHDHLRTLGTSTRRLDALVGAARAAGAWGAKLSGAGGGGCAIALVPLDRLNEVAAAFRDAGATQTWPAQYLLEQA